MEDTCVFPSFILCIGKHTLNRRNGPNVTSPRNNSRWNSTVNPGLDKIKKDAEAEAAALEAQKKLHDAQQALKDAQAPPDPTKKAMDDKLAAAKAAKDLADAEKAAADARKAQSDASLAAFKAQVGEVPQSSYTGDVTLKDKAGATEAGLLAAKAVKTAAQQIIKDLLPAAKDKTVLLYTASEAPNFQAQIAFKAQIALVKKAYDDAEVASQKANTQAPEPTGFKLEAVPIAAAAGLTLDAVNKLLGYFRTDYTIGGIDLTTDDSMLVHELAGRLSDRNIAVRLPAVYNPGALADSGSSVLNEMIGLSYQKVGAQEKSNRHDKLSLRFTEDAGKEKDEKKKGELQDKAKIHKAAADAWKTATGLHDAFFSKLITVDDKGLVPLTNIIREGVIAEALSKDNLLLIVKLQKSGGAYYVKKNLWTFFGTMPFYNMGGVVASYVLLDGKEGAVLKSGVVPVHSGFVKVNDLSDELTRP